MNGSNGPKGRSLVFISLLFLPLIVIAAKLWQVQVLDHQVYLRLAQVNAAQSMPVLAPRGLIYDRTGKLLVGNRAVFSVYVLQTELRNKESVLKRLSGLLSVPYESIAAKVTKKKARPFDPIMVAQDIPMEKVAKIEEQRASLPGVVVNVRPVRYYPNGSAAAHVLGYIGEVTAQDLEKDRSANMRSGDLIGKAGIEKTYDAYLRGINGGEKIFGSKKGEDLDRRKLESLPGKNLTLAIDIELQKAAEAALGAKAGAVIVLDPNSGEVLALVSHPSYDPNIFSKPVSPEEWKKLFSGNHPFMNRALATYNPGSTFKVVSLAAALEKKLFRHTDRFICRGSLKIGSRIARCWNLAGHGSLDLLNGLVNSCNVVFYNVGLKVGPDILHDYARKFGLGERTGIDLPGEAPGIVPSSGWKKEVYKEMWYPGDSMNFAIGQGYLWVTPIQVANLYASIANGASRFEPHLIMSIKDRDGEDVFVYKPKKTGDVPLNTENLGHMKSALHAVVTRGTGRAARIKQFEAAGKTGTAQNPRKPPHAWFVCYAPHDAPRVLVASFVEYGEHGDRVTARIAREVLQWYYNYRVRPPDAPLVKAAAETGTAESSGGAVSVQE